MLKIINKNAKTLHETFGMKKEDFNKITKKSAELATMQEKSKMDTIVEVQELTENELIFLAAQGLIALRVMNSKNVLFSWLV